MSNHTPEPWSVVTEHSGTGDFETRIESEEGQLIADLWDSGNSFADANRIVACVNACAGISNELLEQTSGRIDRYQKAYDKIRHERDRLLDVVEHYIAFPSDDNYQVLKKVAANARGK